MLEKVVGCKYGSDSVGADSVSEHMLRLCRNPDNPELRKSVEAAFAADLVCREASEYIPYGAHMFECVRHQVGLQPPVRHALLGIVDRSLACTAPAYRQAGMPLPTLAALDDWATRFDENLWDALLLAGTGRAPVPLTPDEQALEQTHRALLGCVCPKVADRLAAVATMSGSGLPEGWRDAFVGHLRRGSLLTLDALIKPAALTTLLQFLASSQGQACLQARAAFAPAVPDALASAPASDPPEMTELQQALFEMLDEAAGADGVAREAYLDEISERMMATLHSAS